MSWDSWLWAELSILKDALLVDEDLMLLRDSVLKVFSGPGGADVDEA